MPASMLDDAFAHHVWATKRLAEACGALSDEQLTTPVNGTYGSILDTLRHIVSGDSFYQTVLTGRDHVLSRRPDTMDIREINEAMDALGDEWTRILAEDPDPEKMLREVDDRYERDATVSLRIAQALHHGNDHRTHICTAFTLLGLEPPDVSVWHFGIETGRSTDNERES